MRSLLSTILLLVVILLAFSVNAIACACCAEPGTYSISMFRPDSYQIEILGKIKFSKSAALFMNEAGFEVIKGLSEIQSEYESGSWVSSPGEFSLVDLFLRRTWKLAFKTPAGRTGTLNLPMPTQMTSFKTDLHDGSDQGNGPSLYKEFRFMGTVSGGTGIFRASLLRPAKYLLVFQGRGNNCDNAEDFSHWHLDITGTKADYSFFGKLDRKENSPAAN